MTDLFKQALDALDKANAELVAIYYEATGESFQITDTGRDVRQVFLNAMNHGWRDFGKDSPDWRKLSSSHQL